LQPSNEDPAKSRGFFVFRKFPGFLLAEDSARRRLHYLDQNRKQQPGKRAPAATTNLNSAKAEAKLVKALDYLVAINDNSDNPAQKKSSPHPC
jgi:hypothetical protein